MARIFLGSKGRRQSGRPAPWYRPSSRSTSTTPAAVSPARAPAPAPAPASIRLLTESFRACADSYRLCKPDASGEITEAGCQQLPLAFATNTTEIRYHDGSRAPFQIPATTTDVGTWPANSQWRKNPIPMCNCDLGVGCSKPSSLEAGEGVDPGMLTPCTSSHLSLSLSSSDSHGSCAWLCTDNKTYLQPGQNVEETCGSDGLQFATSWEDGYGGYAQGKNVAALSGGVGSTFSMVDQLRLPEGISGDYILSWRCESRHN